MKYYQIFSYTPYFSDMHMNLEGKYENKVNLYTCTDINIAKMYCNVMNTNSKIQEGYQRFDKYKYVIEYYNFEELECNELEYIQKHINNHIGMVIECVNDIPIDSVKEKNTITEIYSHNYKVMLKSLA